MCLLRSFFFLKWTLVKSKLEISMETFQRGRNSKHKKTYSWKSMQITYHNKNHQSFHRLWNNCKEMIPRKHARTWQLRRARKCPEGQLRKLTQENTLLRKKNKRETSRNCDNWMLKNSSRWAHTNQLTAWLCFVNKQLEKLKNLMA